DLVNLVKTCEAWLKDGGACESWLEDGGACEAWLEACEAYGGACEP
ncbi:hypothetical protein Tco_1578672, partial [Tanacetum coccineum]